MKRCKVRLRGADRDELIVTMRYLLPANCGHTPPLASEAGQDVQTEILSDLYGLLY
jgi:hypothetical protein